MLITNRLQLDDKGKDKEGRQNGLFLLMLGACHTIVKILPNIL